MKARPTVSIILPTLNRARLLERAIRSVFVQTCRDWELIVVDDGSSDDTQAVVEAAAARTDRPVRYFHQENAGSSAARNRGIDAARGRFVAFLDSDDEYMPAKLQRQIDLFHLCPDLGLVYSDYAYVDTAGVRHDSVFRTMSRRALSVRRRSVAPGLYRCNADFFDELLEEYLIATIAGMVRRDVLSGGVRFPEGISYAEEWYFFLQAAKRTRVGFVNEPLCLHHWTEGSLSRTSVQHNTAQRERLLQRVAREVGPLSRRQRRMLRRHRAESALQLGYESARVGARLGAAAWFIRATARGAFRSGASALISTLWSILRRPRGVRNGRGGRSWDRLAPAWRHGRSCSRLGPAFTRTLRAG
ncbi:MAG: glycosyltransferase family 2 protein [Phycisphaerales bacterium]|nr:MAG: glycosyltransferase family 2 protein [Phycisphaerales bacterium]